VDIRYNIPRTPRNNPTERYNQTLETMMRSYVGDRKKDWDARLPHLQAALRSGVNEVTGHLPHLLVYGTELLLDGRGHQFDGKEAEPEVGDRAGYLPALRLQQQKLFEEVAQRMKIAHERNKKRYDLRRRDVSYPVGTRFWRKNFVQSDAADGFTAKLAPKWLGPCTVKKKLGMWTYELADDSGTSLGRWHVDQLKQHFQRRLAGTQDSQTGGGG